MGRKGRVCNVKKRKGGGRAKCMFIGNNYNERKHECLFCFIITRLLPLLYCRLIIGYDKSLNDLGGI